MTDQRDRVTTDPGLGPIDPDNSATLRSIENAVEVEPDGASYYFEAKPLVPVSDHRTLEMQTVKLSDEIDPRKLPTELSLPRSPTPPRYDSGWPQAEVVLTSTQRPAPLRRWRVPAVLLTLLGGLLLLVLGRAIAQRASNPSGIAVAPQTVAAPQLAPVQPIAVLAAPAASVSAVPSAAPVLSAAAPNAVHAAPAPPAVTKLSHASPKATLQASASTPLNASVSTKPKRAIY